MHKIKLILFLICCWCLLAKTALANPYFSFLLLEQNIEDIEKQLREHHAVFSTEYDVKTQNLAQMIITNYPPLLKFGKFKQAKLCFLEITKNNYILYDIHLEFKGKMQGLNQLFESLKAQDKTYKRYTLLEDNVTFHIKDNDLPKGLNKISAKIDYARFHLPYTTKVQFTIDPIATIANTSMMYVIKIKDLKKYQKVISKDLAVANENIEFEPKFAVPSNDEPGEKG